MRDRVRSKRLHPTSNWGCGVKVAHLAFTQGVRVQVLPAPLCLQTV